MFLQTPQLWSSVSTCSDRSRNKLWPSFAFAFQGGMSSFLGLGYGVIEPFRPPNPPSNRWPSPGFIRPSDCCDRVAPILDQRPLAGPDRHEKHCADCDHESIVIKFHQFPMPTIFKALGRRSLF